MNKRHICFVLGRFGVGGTERVTVSLANTLAERGWSVTVIAFEFSSQSIKNTLGPLVRVFELSFPAFSWKNLRRLRRILEANEVDYVINQWALPFPVTALLRMAMKPGTKLIAFHHTMPNRNSRIMGGGELKKVMWRILSALNLRLVYRFSDAYGILSESFRPIFENFTGIRDARKLRAIPNPVPDQMIEGQHKENLILFVGRLANVEKRVDRILEVWELIASQLPSWHLEIVGDGPDRESLEERASTLPRISFKGYQPPSKYYERAKILLLTSDYEGFGLVLVEAMKLGCVPVVYGSFSSVYDIVNSDNTNGIAVPTPWSAERFSQEVAVLAADGARREMMARRGIESSKRFDVDVVVKRYEHMLEALG